jgi:hypothetical protein
MTEETLEEAAQRYTEEHKWEEQDPWLDFIAGAKWQQERMYSEEDMEEAFTNGLNRSFDSDFDRWLSHFKKK